jgi:hypothetical protein
MLERSTVRARTRSQLLLLALLASFGCQAPIQVVKLEIEPRTASVFVDGAPVSAEAGEVSLRSDRSHVVFVRGEGYRAEQFVLETREQDGVHALEPAELRVRLSPLVPTEHGVVIESAD